jgi:hypothetical protein
LLQKFPIDYGEVEDLFKDFPKLLSYLNPTPEVGYVLDNYTAEPEHEARSIMRKLEYFDKKEAEHLKKFVNGEVDDPRFP